MPSTLRTLLCSTALSLTVGCNFFSLDDQDLKNTPKKAEGAAGKAEGTAGKTATGGASGGGMSSTGGSTSSGGMGTGGSVTPGSGGSGGSAGSDTMAGAGGTSGGMPSLGGMGGDAVSSAGTSGGSAGGSTGGMTGSAGSGATGCAAMNPGAQPFGGHCYLLVSNPVSFDAAKNGCMAMNAHLVTISNGTPAMQSTFDAEDMFVYTLSGMKDTWLGLTDGKMPKDAGDGTPYTWITGEDSPLAEWGMAYGWDSGEPNNYNKPCANGDSCYEHCGGMVADKDDKWNDDLCETTKQYVCEWDAGG